MYRNINNFYLSRPNFGYAYGNPYGMNFSKSPRVVVYSRNFAELPTVKQKWDLITNMGLTEETDKKIFQDMLSSYRKRFFKANRAAGSWDPQWAMLHRPREFLKHVNPEGYPEFIRSSYEDYPRGLIREERSKFLRDKEKLLATRNGLDMETINSMKQSVLNRIRTHIAWRFLEGFEKEVEERQRLKREFEKEEEERQRLKREAEKPKESVQPQVEEPIQSIPMQNTPQPVQPQAKEIIQSAPTPPTPQPVKPQVAEIVQSVPTQSTTQPAQPQVEEPIQSAPIPLTPQPVQPQAEAKQQSPVASGRGFRFPFFGRKEKPKSPVQTPTPKEAKIRPVWNGNPIQYTVETLDSIENPLGSVIKKLDSIENPMSSVIKKLDSIENPLARFFKK